MEWRSCASASMYAAFLSTTQVSLPGGSTTYTGWKNLEMSAGLFKLSGASAGVPAIALASVSAFFKGANSLPMFCFTTSVGAAGGGKFVALAVMTNTARSGDLRSARFYNFQSASAALAYLVTEKPSTNFRHRST